jgi:hypothetical protein
MVVFEQVSAVLERAIRELEIPVDAAALARSCALLDRLSAKVTAAVGAFDAAEAWRDSGAVSMTAWLRRHAGRSGRDAARLVRTARRLAALPVTAAAYGDGALSGGQVQAIVANLNDDTTRLFAESESEMVAKLARLGVGDVSRVMQRWAAAAKDHLQPDPGADGENPDEPVGPERSLHLSETLDGRGEISGSLDPEGRALAETALRLAETPDSEAEPERTPARRRADALVDIFRFFLDHQTARLGGRHRPHLNVIVDYDDLVGDRPCPRCRTSTATGGFDGFARRASNGSRAGANGTDGDTFGCAGRGGEGLHHDGLRRDGPAGRGARARRGTGRLLDGTVLDAATLHRLACDAGVHRVVMAGRSTILDYGSTTRTAPANLWAAVVARDRHCRFPGCDRPPQWCEAHHLVSWEHGGTTAIGNLALLCSRHHHVVHAPGWHAKLLPDGTVEVTDPDGRVHATRPPGHLDSLFETGRSP